MLCYCQFCSDLISDRLNLLFQSSSFSDITFVTVTDVFFLQSEYIAPRDARLAWMSGFTGSAGVFHSQLIIILLYHHASFSVTLCLSLFWSLTNSPLLSFVVTNQSLFLISRNSSNYSKQGCFVDRQPLLDSGRETNGL